MSSDDDDDDDDDDCSCVLLHSKTAVSFGRFYFCIGIL